MRKVMRQRIKEHLQRNEEEINASDNSNNYGICSGIANNDNSKSVQTCTENNERGILND